MWLGEGTFRNAYLDRIPAALRGVAKGASAQWSPLRVFGFCSQQVICFNLRRKIQESSVMLMGRCFEDICELR